PRRSRRDRAGIQPQRARQASPRGGHAARLHAHPGARDAVGLGLRGREPRGGPVLRVAGPADPLPLTAAAPPGRGRAARPHGLRRPGAPPRGGGGGGRPHGLGRRARLPPLGVLGGAVLLAMTLAAILALWLAPYTPLDTDYSRLARPPSLAHPLGTDHFGRDVL